MDRKELGGWEEKEMQPFLPKKERKMVEGDGVKMMDRISYYRKRVQHPCPFSCESTAN